MGIPEGCTPADATVHCDEPCSIVDDRMRLRARVAELEGAIRRALPLETYWRDYEKEKQVADTFPLSSALNITGIR